MCGCPDILIFLEFRFAVFLKIRFVFVEIGNMRLSSGKFMIEIFLYFFHSDLQCFLKSDLYLWKWAMCGCPAANDCRGQERLELAGNADDDKTKMGAPGKISCASHDAPGLVFSINAFCNLWSPKFANQSGKGKCLKFVCNTLTKTCTRMSNMIYKRGEDLIAFSLLFFYMGTADCYCSLVV